MRLLVLGGTKFLGRHVVAEAVANGHEVTVFTRGQTNPELFPEADHLVGDRDGDLDALRGHEWDGVVDTSAYVPRVARQSGELLCDAVGRYVFVSSISVYADLSAPVNESSALAELEDPATEDILPNYGGLKAACENVFAELYGERASNVRAGLIVGPHDPTGRFTYWVERVADGGDVLVPEPADSPVQFIDARDLARLLTKLAQDGPGGPMNATGPATRLGMGELVERIAAATGAECNLRWVDPDKLVATGVEPWTELPLWLPGEEYAGLCQADIGRALAAGLEFLPVEETAVDTLEWARTAGLENATLSRERERELLADLAPSS